MRSKRPTVSEMAFANFGKEKTYLAVIEISLDASLRLQHAMPVVQRDFAQV
jgi:hypothetical protein